jgi:hypothetical protein
MEKPNPKRKLPVFRAFIDEEFAEVDGKEVPTGLNAISFVDHPATDMMWMAFADHKQMKFQVTDKEKKIVSGVAMAADMPIYRNENGFEFYVQFSKEDIFKIGKKFFKNNLINKVNLMHQDNAYQEGVYIIESIFVDSERGTSAPKQFGELSDGSWWVSFAVDNIDVWENKIKAGEVMGFSVEGIFKHAKIKDEQAQKLENLHDRIAKMRKELSKFVTNQ